MTRDLQVYLGAHRCGRLEQERGGRAAFTYDAKWQERPGAYPLSLSLPLAARHHRPKVVDPYLWGLLPDNELILERWGRRFQVSPRNAFALLADVGADCPGAVRFLRPDQPPDGDGTIDWLGETQVAERLRALRQDAAAWRLAGDAGQFSLAGAQPKTALWFDGSRWGVPRGTIPTTHILKPGIVDLDGSAHNEHICLSIARRLGLPVAASRIARFEDEVAIVIERYDRAFTPTGVVRVHQEDACQALGVHPARKYQNEGGPGALDIVELLWASSDRANEDVDSFVGALVFNWLVAGTDAHAKNYSLLVGHGGRARLAPLYDVASALPYPELPFQKLKLAMRIGGKYRLRDIGRHQWTKLAEELSLDAERVLSIARKQTSELAEATRDVIDHARTEGLRHAVLERLESALCERAGTCAGLLG